MKHLRVALAGNPNTGKTTIFNNLTGSRQKVGNYPGVTVEKRSGLVSRGDCELELVDLPGIYSLGASTLDEKVARDYLIRERPDVIINVVDASNLERSLYLTTQLLELDIPVVLAANMCDLADASGVICDYATIGNRFSVPVVCMVGNRQTGSDELLDAAVLAAETTGRVAFSLSYGVEIDSAILELVAHMPPAGDVRDGLDAMLKTEKGRRWIAARLLEHDSGVWHSVAGEKIKQMAGRISERLARLHGESAAVMIADARYGYISGVCTDAVRNTVELRHSLSDKIDILLTHNLLGMPIFLAMMYLVFKITFSLAEFPMALIESGIGLVSSGLAALWPGGQLLWLKSLLLDGVIAGVGGVIVFLPSIVLLFMSIAILEHSGYMARAAFIMDRLMHRIGLHGKSFIPMIIGFGCTVPAIMATRTLDSRRDRLLTMLVLPLMSCGARFTIYALVIPAFFPAEWRAPVLWIVYFIGIALAILGIKLLGATVLKGESPGMVIELPPYRMPTIRTVVIHMWERAWMYLRKAGTIILAASVVMWVLLNYPCFKGDATGMSEPQLKAAQVENSIAGRIGRTLDPVLSPMGFDWRLGTALIGTIAAKEVFVSQMAVVLASGDTGSGESLREALRENYSPLTGFCMLLFTLIGFPCAATVAVVRSESGRWKYALLQFAALTILAWLITTATFQIGSLIPGLAG